MILFSFFLFTSLIAIATYLLTCGDDHGTAGGCFLPGRRLTWPIIAGALLLTNLSTEQIVGLNGADFNDGFSVLAWEVPAVVALVDSALFFFASLPKECNCHRAAVYRGAF